jgi:hypothetical protein
VCPSKAQVEGMWRDVEPTLTLPRPLNDNSTTLALPPGSDETSDPDNLPLAIDHPTASLSPAEQSAQAAVRDVVKPPVHHVICSPKPLALQWYSADTSTGDVSALEFDTASAASKLAVDTETSTTVSSAPSPHAVVADKAPLTSESSAALDVSASTHTASDDVV